MATTVRSQLSHQVVPHYEGVNFLVMPIVIKLQLSTNDSGYSITKVVPIDSGYSITKVVLPELLLIAGV